MGYALFAAQKINYSNLIFNYQMQLNAISDERIKLTEFIANISDGDISVDDILSDPTNIDKYLEFNESSNSYAGAMVDGDGTEGHAGIDIEELAGEGASDTDKENIRTALIEKYKKEHAKYYQKKYEVEDQKLEAQQKKIETKLTAAQKQLEQIEQAEAKAIDSATPKYAGLG